MKLLTAFVTTVALLGFGSAAFACSGMQASKQQQVATSRRRRISRPPRAEATAHVWKKAAAAAFFI
jgi:hypothetical protein